MLFQKSLFAVLMIGMLYLFSSCSKKGGSDAQAPVANFSYSGAGLAPATVTFSNSSTNASSYSWDFGDNSTSTQTNPTHTYTKGGVYTVRLTANGSGGSNSITKTVNITAPTSVKINGVKVTAMPFTDPSTGGGWDNNSGPDVYYTITDAYDVVLVNSTTYYPDVTSANLPLSFTLTTPYLISNLAATYKIKIWDYDGNDFPPNPDDFIGGYQFSFSDYAALGYPTTILLQNSTSQLKIELTVQWQ